MSKTKPNLKVLVALRVKGKHCAVGDVIPKSAFGESKRDWQNLLNMKPARVEETDDKVSKAGETTKNTTKKTTKKSSDVPVPGAPGT